MLFHLQIFTTIINTYERKREILGEDVRADYFCMSDPRMDNKPFSASLLRIFSELQQYWLVSVFVACVLLHVHVHVWQPQDEILTVIRRVDDNWAEGMLGDKIGIFPLLYVEVRSCSQTRFLFHPAVCFPRPWGVGVESWPRTLLPREEGGDWLGFCSDCCASAMRIASASQVVCPGPGCRLSYCVGREGLGYRLAPFLMETLCWHPLSPDSPSYCRSGLPSPRGEGSSPRNTAEECWLWQARLQFSKDSLPWVARPTVRP